jgi:hypothetical protein
MSAWRRRRRAERAEYGRLTKGQETPLRYADRSRVQGGRRNSARSWTGPSPRSRTASPRPWTASPRRRASTPPAPGPRGRRRGAPGRGDPRRQPGPRPCRHRRDGLDMTLFPPPLTSSAEPGSPPSPASPAPAAASRKGPRRLLPAPLLHPGRHRHRDDRHLPRRTAPPPVTAPRRKQGPVRRRTLHPRHHLAPPRQPPRPATQTSAPAGTPARPRPTAGPAA